MRPQPHRSASLTPNSACRPPRVSAEGIKMSRHLQSRLASSLVSATLVIGALLASAGPGLADANSRTVFFGSPTSATGTVTFTDAFTSNATATDILFRNDSPCTLNHVRLSGGAQVPTIINPASAPSFCTVSGGVVTCPPSLPSDTHYLPVYVSSASTVA